MQNLGRVIILILLSLNIAIGAGVETTVSTSEVVQGNMVQLRIKAIGGSVGFPKITQIAGNKVINTSTSSQYSASMINGTTKMEQSTTKSMTFRPTHDMTIPSYTVNISGIMYKTKPIQIKVVHSNAPQVSKSKKYTFILKSSKESVGVGESFLVTLYFSMSNDLGVEQVTEYVEPSSADFFIKDMGGQKQYRKGNATVLEKRYMVTAKEEGNFTLSPASAKVGIADKTKQDIFGRFAIRWIQVSSNSLQIKVLPQKIDTDLVGDFRIDTQVDRQKIEANKPVNLTIKIKGKGSLEDFEFPKYEIDNVTIYSDDAKVESHMVGEDLVSTYTKSFAFIAETDFTIPKRMITLYNPDIKKEKTLTAPEYKIEIKGNKKTSSPLKNLNTSNTIVAKKQTDEKKEYIEQKAKVKTFAWWVLVLTFVFGMLFMYGLRYISHVKFKNRNIYSNDEALKILYAHMGESKEVEEMVRKLYARKNGDKSIQIDKKKLKELVERFR